MVVAALGRRPRPQTRVRQGPHGAGLDPVVVPRSPGSYPGYVFTGEPLRLPAAHVGLGHGDGAHAPDEYYVIESESPRFTGFDGAVRSFVDYLYELSTIG